MSTSLLLFICVVLAVLALVIPWTILPLKIFKVLVAYPTNALFLHLMCNGVVLFISAVVFYQFGWDNTNHQAYEEIVAFFSVASIACLICAVEQSINWKKQAEQEVSKSE